MHLLCGEPDLEAIAAMQSSQPQSQHHKNEDVVALQERVTRLEEQVARLQQQLDELLN